MQRQPLSIDGSGAEGGIADAGRDRLPIPGRNAPATGSTKTAWSGGSTRSSATSTFASGRCCRCVTACRAEQPLSLGDIGKVMRVSKERIRQIEESAMAKLRQPQHAAQFVAVLSRRRPSGS